MATLEEAVRARIEHDLRDEGVIQFDTSPMDAWDCVDERINRMSNLQFLELLSSVLPDVEDGT